MRLDDQRAVGRGRGVGDEEAVDLELGEGQLAQLHQGRIAGAEIVDGKADALDAEAGQRVHQLDQRLGRALGQFEHEALGRDAERAAHALDEVGEIELVEAQRADVEGDAGVEPLVAPAEPLAQRGAQAPLGQFVDQAVLFGQRHEARRRHHADARDRPSGPAPRPA